jgi:hypothetical protein
MTIKPHTFLSIIITSIVLHNFAYCQIESNTAVTVHNKTPEQIYNFLITLNPEKYLKWHPEHTEFKAVRINPEVTGSIFYFNDLINGEKVENNWTVIEAVKSKKLLMQSSKNSVGMTIKIELTQDGNNTLVNHQLKVGKGFMSWLVKLFFTEKMIKDLQRHVKEEFTNLEWLIQ